MKKLIVLCCAAFTLCMAEVAVGQEEVIFQQDFESDVVGQPPSGRWYVNAGAGASCLVSDEATDVPGSPAGTKNLKFAKAGTGGGSQLTVQWIFEEHAEKVMTSGKLTANYWVYFASGALMRHIAFRGYSPYKHYMKMAIRGNWPDDIRLEFPINGAQKVLSGAAWHKLTFVMEWDPVWPLPAAGIPKAEVRCRFFVDDEEHPGSPATILEDLVSPFGSVELNTGDSLTAVAYFDDISVRVALPPPAVKSLAWDNGKLALRWADPVKQLGNPTVYQAEDMTGPWLLVQGNIESACLIHPGQGLRSFYRIGPKEEPSPERKVIFADDFEAYTTTDEVAGAGGWTIVNNSGAPEVQWRLWNTAGEPLNTEDPNLLGMSGNYIISDSDLAQSANLDEEFITPVIDCAGYTRLWLDFNSNMRVYGDESEPNRQVMELDISLYDPGLDTWSQWMNVFTRDRASGDWSSDNPKSFGLSPLADEQKMKLRWHFYEAQYDYWWAIDNVRVTGE